MIIFHEPTRWLTGTFLATSLLAVGSQYRAQLLNPIESKCSFESGYCAPHALHVSMGRPYVPTTTSTDDLTPVDRRGRW